MRSSPHPIPTIPPAKPKFTTVASVARCCPPSARWTDTCLSTLGSVLSHVNVVDKLLRPTATCTDTRGPTGPETLAKATAAAELAPTEANREVVSAVSGRQAWSSQPQPSAPSHPSPLPPPLSRSPALSNLRSCCCSSSTIRRTKLEIFSACRP